MKKKAEALKVGDKLLIGGQILVIKSVELSDISKQGTKKCRIEAIKPDGESVVIIRPAEYPMDCQ